MSPRERASVVANESAPLVVRAKSLGHVVACHYAEQIKTGQIQSEVRDAA